MTYEQREIENLRALLEFEKKERMQIFINTIRYMTNAEWDEIKKRDPQLHGFVKQAVNRE